ncbi:AAA family ATPase [Sphingobacterium spiritivorum]|uniref:AAA family ATPase n=1 Tax=Sphingobacterium spiritivorum TaxID=258 RepID=UPI003DA5CDD0
MKNQALQQEVQGLISDRMKLKEISQNRLAEMMDVSPATLSNIMNGHWERVNDAFLLKVKSFFAVKDWTLIETTNFITIQEACEKARHQRRLIGIVGYSGAGKTTALRNYFESHSNTYMVTCSRSMRTKQFLSEILKSLGINFLASDYDMVRMIVDELNKVANPLLVIDEASKLSNNALMYLQDITDGVENNGGIVIAGVEYLLSNLKKASDRNKTGMPEFFRRVSLWQELTAPSRKEIEGICINNGVTDPDTIRQISRLSNFGYVRNAILNHINN